MNPQLTQNGVNHISNDIKQEVSHSVDPQNGDNGHNLGQIETNEEPEPEVDITISNVVSNFSVKCHLNLRQIACNGSNVVYKREQSVCPKIYSVIIGINA